LNRGPAGEQDVRNDIVTGVGGKQILLGEPVGNPELFEPGLPEARLSNSVKRGEM
jgi:hypothetical protein